MINIIKNIKIDQYFKNNVNLQSIPLFIILK